MTRNSLLAGVLLLAAAQAWAIDQHSVQGIVVKADPIKRTIVVSCDAIPGYMEAMVMPFTVRGTEDLKEFLPGAAIRFTMVESGGADYAEHLQVVQVTNYESEPTEANRLTFLHRTMDPSATEKIVPVGHPVPDFVLTDQAQGGDTAVAVQREGGGTYLYLLTLSQSELLFSAVEQSVETRPAISRLRRN